MSSTTPWARRKTAATLARCLLASFLPALGGCIVSYPKKQNSEDAAAITTKQRHVILGFGIVDINTDEPAAIVTRSRTLGVHLAKEPTPKVAVGYAQSSAVIVPAHAEDVRLEASERDGIFTVTVDSAQVERPKREE